MIGEIQRTRWVPIYAQVSHSDQPYKKDVALPCSIIGGNKIFLGNEAAALPNEEKLHLLFDFTLQKPVEFKGSPTVSMELRVRWLYPLHRS